MIMVNLYRNPNKVILKGYFPESDFLIYHFAIQGVFQKFKLNVLIHYNLYYLINIPMFIRLFKNSKF
ncbi:hypothetical protein BpHYR1_015919 [Brachionus plicatilis]|uniref:Uncharacterized protein n=1 Tax=Brachionus plicatilis TaxID=10195 RepID=A0A3M7R3B8_BRAPC|nr:hypothetical protein BpHYR1_015919 [Brachionus plicatilis]